MTKWAKKLQLGTPSVDHNVTAAAEQAIEQYGNGKSFKLEEATKDIYFVDKNK